MGTVRISHLVDPRFVLDPFEPAYLSLPADEIGRARQSGVATTQYV